MHYIRSNVRNRSRARAAAMLVVTWIWLNGTPVAGQTADAGIIGGNIKKRTSGVLTLMGYTLTPDVTTGSIAISDGETGNPEIMMISLGGGATISKGFPLYLEGKAGEQAKEGFKINGQYVNTPEIRAWSAFRSLTAMSRRRGSSFSNDRRRIPAGPSSSTSTS